MTRDVLQPNRGWGDLEWDVAGTALMERGLLGPEGRTTEAGLEALAQVEGITDRLAQEPWDAAGPDIAEQFLEVAEPIALAARTALPDVTPLGLPTAPSS